MKGTNTHAYALSLTVEFHTCLIGQLLLTRRHREKVCDYQFRIDGHIVCDATRLGNVARYINASCSPNCYTQIITAYDEKRIVIYAKKDIQPGEGEEDLSEDAPFKADVINPRTLISSLISNFHFNLTELCYDYKFPLEYDPEKRIPCHCKSQHCKGFMNWVRATLLVSILHIPSKPSPTSYLFSKQDKKYVLIDNPSK